MTIVKLGKNDFSGVQCGRNFRIMPKIENHPDIAGAKYVVEDGYNGVDPVPDYVEKDPNFLTAITGGILQIKETDSIVYNPADRKFYYNPEQWKKENKEGKTTAKAIKSSKEVPAKQKAPPPKGTGKE